MITKYKERLNKYIQYNYNKLNKIYETLNHEDRAILKLIPYLIHINHIGLPGYVTLTYKENIQLKFPDINITDKIISDLKIYFPKIVESMSKNEFHVATHPKLLNLSLMGSPGSIVFNKKSDFDFWIIYDDSCDKYLVNQLEKKINDISKWLTKKISFETNFFLLKLSDLQKNHFGMLKGESCGSLLRQFLKEEFLRSFTIITGHYFCWCCISPYLSEEEYKKESKKIMESDLRKELINIHSYINFNKEELFGGVFWNFLKSWSAPFKSLLKILLLEAYILYNPDTLCDNIKKLIIENPNDIFADPYLLLFEKTSEYLIKINDIETLKLIRYSLYLKISEKINYSDDLSYIKIDYKSKGVNYRKAIINNYVLSWNFNKDNITFLNNILKGTLKDYKLFSKMIINAFNKSYQRIQNYIELENISMINRDDLMVLRRKINLYFVSKKNKISYQPEYLNEIPLKKLFLNEKQITGQYSVWYLSNQLKDIKNNYLEKNNDLIAIIIKYCINNVIKRSTPIRIMSNNPFVNNNVIKTIISFFDSIKYDRFDKDKDYITDCLFIPFLTNDFKSVSISVIFKTSKNEIFYHKFSDKKYLNSVLKFLTDRKDLIRKELNIDIISYDTAITNEEPKEHLEKINYNLTIIVNFFFNEFSNYQNKNCIIFRNNKLSKYSYFFVQNNEIKYFNNNNFYLFYKSLFQINNSSKIEYLFPKISNSNINRIKSILDLKKEHSSNVVVMSYQNNTLNIINCDTFNNIFFFSLPNINHLEISQQILLLFRSIGFKNKIIFYLYNGLKLTKIDENDFTPIAKELVKLEILYDSQNNMVIKINDTKIKVPDKIFLLKAIKLFYLKSNRTIQKNPIVITNIDKFSFNQKMEFNAEFSQYLHYKFYLEEFINFNIDKL